MPTAKKNSNNSESSVAKNPAKASAGKIVKGNLLKEKPIKYNDKSEGQPELSPIFDAIKALMKPYVKGPMRERGEAPGIYTLVSEKPVEIEGRKKDELYFAGIIVQKGYVGFYFMPVYDGDKPEEIFHPNLLKLLKGKGCFHIKKNDPELLKQINDALKAGFDLYKRKGWV